MLDTLLYPTMKHTPVLAFCILALAAHLPAQAPAANSDLDLSASPLRPYIESFSIDRTSLMRYYAVELDPARAERMKRFLTEWRQRLSTINFDVLPQDGKVDYVVFRNYLDHELKKLGFDAKAQAETAPYTPFAATIAGLEETRKKTMPLKPQDAAAKLQALTTEIDNARKTIDQQVRVAGNQGTPLERQERKVIGARAAANVTALRGTLRTWFSFYDSYDPLFTWWAAERYAVVDAALQSYAAFLRERVGGQPAIVADATAPAANSVGAGGGRGGGVGGRAGGAAGTAGARAGSTGDIVGNPIGRDGLMSELTFEMIPYTPEELIAIANKEFAWCEEEMKKASREMGYGDDWKKALEKVKTMYVEPGKQPELIRALAREAEKFLDDHNLITVPSVAHETWRMEMMSPERQLVNPFFTGGETISVSYPVATMTYEQKLMSMRGNNIPFSRATVFHELIPGHELQGYMASHFRPYRSAVGGTPFVTEGWSLYWELLLYEMKFQKTPEDRVGALFWRMHRCARIIFSLNFHLGKMTPDECIDFLVNRVGHERENAVGEVRRSFAGGYSPLYQAAYLLGGMQLYALRKEMAGPGKMSDRQFHDAVLKENRIPIEMLRADLTNQKLTREYQTTWKFYGEAPRQ
jgi:uncharacterized protein (DUF885 family)